MPLKLEVGALRKWGAYAFWLGLLTVVYMDMLDLMHPG